MPQSSQKRVILGTAGHIDHGKTSLVRSLTGIDTDRLKEERERGITIELGFADLTLPSGVRLAIVDVPGHERFVKNMVAGATGIDLVLLVVAADEGVMPQTREHLDICTLLQVPAGLVALTKTDMVDEEMVELATEDVRDLLLGTFLEGAPIIPVSAVSGAGLDVLTAELDRLVAETPQRDAKGTFRLPVDRVFSMRGFGTVVTGTLVSGSVRREDDVQILPGGRTGKVRGIQVHGGAEDRAYAGQRVALNLSGLDLTDVHRGNTLGHPGELQTTFMLDARLTVLPSAKKPLEDRTRMRLHLGTQEVPVTVALLDRDALLPGEGCYVQLRTAQKLVGYPGDYFVLRAFSPVLTVGGGRVLDQFPHRHRGRRAEVVEMLDRLETGDPQMRLATFLRNRDLFGLDPVEAQATLGVPLDEARRLLQLVVRDGQAVVTDRKAQRHHHQDVIVGLESQALEKLAGFHHEHPLKKGFGIEELRTKFPRYVQPRLVEFVLHGLAEEGRVVFEGDLVRSGDFTVVLSADDEQLRRRIMDYIEGQGYAAPTGDDVATGIGEDAGSLRPVLDLLVSEEILTRTKEGFYFESSALETLTGQVIGVLKEKGEIGVADIKDLTGTTRKYTIPLLEYLDGKKITTRKGDVRVLGPRGRN